MKKQLIDFDQAKYNSRIGSYQTFKKLIEQAIEIYNSFNIKPFAPKDLEGLILRTEGFVINELIESKDITPLTKMGLDRGKITEMLLLPAGLPVLLEKINQLERFFQRDKEREHLSAQNLKHLLLHYYDFVSDSELALKESIYEDCRKYSETWIETSKAKNLFSFASEIISLYEKYDIKFTGKAENIRFLENLFEAKDDRLAINNSSILDVERRAK